MLPDVLSSPDTNVVLKRFDRRSGLYRVSLLFLDDRLWLGGFDACGHGQPVSNVDAYRLAVDLYRDGQFYSVWLDEKTWVGTTGVLWVDELNGVAMIGRTLVNPDFWGQGVNFVIKKFILSHLFSSGMNEIKVTAVASNRNSLKALHKFGFQETGRELVVNKFTGGKRDTVSLSLFADQWGQYLSTATSPLNVIQSSVQV